MSQWTVGRESTNQRVSVWGEETSKRKGFEGEAGRSGVGRAYERVERMAKRRMNASVVLERAIIAFVLWVGWFVG